MRSDQKFVVINYNSWPWSWKGCQLDKHGCYERSTEESLKRDLSNAFADCMQPATPKGMHQSKLLRYARRYSSPLGNSLQVEIGHASVEISRIRNDRPKSREERRPFQTASSAKFSHSSNYFHSVNSFVASLAFIVFLRRGVERVRERWHRFTIRGVCFREWDGWNLYLKRGKITLMQRVHFTEFRKELIFFYRSYITR